MLGDAGEELELGHGKPESGVGGACRPPHGAAKPGHDVSQLRSDLLATDLFAADLIRARLIRACLIRADLIRADLIRACLIRFLSCGGLVPACLLR